MDMFESAEGVQKAVRGRVKDSTVNEFDFTSQLSFLVTVGYLTKEQARVLLSWFLSQGMMRLPDLPSPDGVPSPTMYETLSTAIHFGTPPGALDAAGDGAPGVLEFFSGLVGIVTDAIGETLDGITDVLNAGTALLQAASGLVQDLHDLVVQAP